MQTDAKTVEQLEAENEELRRQLAEAREALEAIRRGDVDAVVVDRPERPAGLHAYRGRYAVSGNGRGDAGGGRHAER